MNLTRILLANTVAVKKNFVKRLILKFQYEKKIFTKVYLK